MLELGEQTIDMILTQEGSNQLLSFLFFLFFSNAATQRGSARKKKITRRTGRGELKEGWGRVLVMRQGGVEVGSIIESKSPAFSLDSISQRAAGGKTNSGEQ